MSQVVVPQIQPHEAIWLWINFGAKNALIAGDTLKTLISFVCTKVSDGSVVTSTMIESLSPVIVLNKVKFMKKVDAGTHGEDYKATALVETTMGEFLEEDLIIEIRER